MLSLYLLKEIPKEDKCLNVQSRGFMQIDRSTVKLFCSFHAQKSAWPEYSPGQALLSIQKKYLAKKSSTKHCSATPQTHKHVAQHENHSPSHQTLHVTLPLANKDQNLPLLRKGLQSTRAKLYPPMQNSEIALQVYQ